MGRKLGLCPSFIGGGGVRRAGSPSNKMWLGPRPTSVPSGILIHPTVWPQYTDVTDRTDRTGHDRQRSDSIRRTVLQTVAQNVVKLVGVTYSEGFLASRICRSQVAASSDAAVSNWLRRNFSCSKSACGESGKGRASRYRVKCDYGEVVCAMACHILCKISRTCAHERDYYDRPM